ncbi:unnamed protein product [Haemonchus placei]|uniref:Secreted protein n=1 Tax=Haemonchus placei TaxID=6290 RepID=A0A0N4WT05_HAEPC|nr:unnamed protein product [Haemonchus placei]
MPVMTLCRKLVDVICVSADSGEAEADVGSASRRSRKEAWTGMGGDKSSSDGDMSSPTAGTRRGRLRHGTWAQSAHTCRLQKIFTSLLKKLKTL